MDCPKPKEPVEYENAIARMVEKLSAYTGVVSIYQVGGAGTPGISDIDLLVIFQDNARCIHNPVAGLSKTDRYLFTHNLFGTSRSRLVEVLRYQPFESYRFLRGERAPDPDIEASLPEEEKTALSTQIALEYLIKMYINMSVETAYRIVKVRSFLLLSNALLKDLSLLEVGSGRLYELLQDIVTLRMTWFDRKPDMEKFARLYREFHVELTGFLNSSLQRRKLYLPPQAKLKVARNLVIVPSAEFVCGHKGITLPPVFAGLGRKYFNVQHRFNFFTFRVQATSDDMPETLLRRFNALSSAVEYNGANLPRFMPASHGLPIFG
jgi:hypothetical protein